LSINSGSLNILGDISKDPGSSNSLSGVLSDSGSSNSEDELEVNGSSKSLV
jgi:hypothetical protein